MQSTMGAALSAHEEQKILDAWANLVLAANGLRNHREAVQMLDTAADLVGLISELRSAIYNGWHYANARAFPASVAKVATKARQSTALVAEMQQEIEDLLNQIQLAKESQ